MAIINGNAGNNTLSGKAEADTINGFAGNDTITGGLGNDLARMGAGNDTFIWRFGDGNDTLRGQDGFDTLVIEDPDLTTITRDAARAIVFDLSGDVLDLDDIERIFVRALAGVDGIFIENLAGTDLKQVVVDLAGTPGGIVGDGEVDGVVRNGGDGNDIFNVALASGIVSITGPAAAVTVRNADKDDVLELNGLGRNDAINASKLPANVMDLTINGDEGNDTITGSRGNDELDGDEGNDVVAGGRGNDLVDLGTGNDLLVWSQGDGNDTVDGGDGTDTLLITGTRGNNSFQLANNGLLFVMNEITADEVERVRLSTLAGSDSIVIRPMGASSSLPLTDVSAIDIDLAAAVSGTLPDADVDVVRVFASDDIDVVEITWSGNKIVTAGLAAEVSIAHAGASDRLSIVSGTGNDLIDARNLPAGKISLTFENNGHDDTIFGSAGNDRVLVSSGTALARLGAGNDTMDGGAGNDVAHLGAGNDRMGGGAGDDVAHLGSGNDTFDGSGGDDVAHMGAGNDIMNGGAGNDLADLGDGNDRCTWSAGDGSDTIFGGNGIDVFDYRNITNGLFDAFTIEAGVGFTKTSSASGIVSLNSVERLRVMVGGFIDVITVSDLTDTDVKLVAIDLAASVGSVVADGSQDIVILEGTADNDQVTIAKFTGGLSITGLPAQITVTHTDNGGLIADTLTVSGGEGNDTITASAMPDVLNPTFDGGNGNDRILGGACTDKLIGWNGNDTLSGGAKADQLIGGVGNDRLFGDAGADQLLGEEGNDVLVGGRGNDQITCGDGADRVSYTSVLDGHDVVLDFDGDPAGGQDVLDLDALFDSLGIAASKRAGLVDINDLGGTVEISVNADGKAGFELVIATLNTADAITKGQDVIVGT
jgi:Ca2+-binding RTX toxin-like protein